MKPVQVLLVVLLVGGAGIAGFALGFYNGHQAQALSDIVTNAELDRVRLQQLDAGNTAQLRSMLEVDEPLVRQAQDMLENPVYRIGEWLAGVDVVRSLHTDPGP